LLFSFATRCRNADNVEPDDEAIALVELGVDSAAIYLVAKIDVVRELIFSLALTEKRNATSERERRM